MGLRYFWALASVALSTLPAAAYTNLASAYAALGFNPTVTSNAVIVFFSDPHMNLDSLSGTTPLTTNLDATLLNPVNAMTPPPARIVVAGDCTSSYSYAPGEGPNVPLGTNEMALWLSAIQAFTNIAQTNILWVSGNHDQAPGETNAELFTRICGQPPHQSFELSGVRFLLMNGGNCGDPSDDEKGWLAQQAASIPTNQQFAVVVHQHPFGNFASERGIGPVLDDLFGDRPVRWWVFAGHAHSLITDTIQVRRSTVGIHVTSTVNPLPYYGAHTRGFTVICLSNAVVGNIFYRADTGDWQVMTPPSWSRPAWTYAKPFEGVPGLLWRRFKTPTHVPEAVVTNSYDATEWWRYPLELQWAMPLNLHSNLATHFVLLCGALDSTTQISFSSDRQNWLPVPIPLQTNQVYAFPIPTNIAGLATGYARLYATNRPEVRVGGWGLVTTNTSPLVTYPVLAAISNQEAVVGQVLSVSNVVLDPYAPPDHLTFHLVDAPPGATVDPHSGVVQWQPAPDAPPTVPITVTVSDGGLAPMVSTQRFLVNVAHPVPYLYPPVNRNGLWSLQIAADPNRSYSVFASTNLVNWVFVAHTNPAATPFQITDPSSEAPQRFYMVRVDP
jgi:predicted phosphodiesterase